MRERDGVIVPGVFKTGSEALSFIRGRGLCTKTVIGRGFCATDATEQKEPWCGGAKTTRRAAIDLGMV
jgi:hypothetical protein